MLSLWSLNWRGCGFESMIEIFCIPSVIKFMKSLLEFEFEFLHFYVGGITPSH